MEVTVDKLNKVEMNAIIEALLFTYCVDINADFEVDDETLFEIAVKLQKMMGEKATLNKFYILDGMHEEPLKVKNLIANFDMKVGK
jgi:hypothetical protein